nr:hypothetical protein [Pseudogemmobacter faecipullorum]
MACPPTPRAHVQRSGHTTGKTGSVAKFLVSSTTFDMPLFSGSWGEARGVIEFKGVHYPKSVILYAVFFYVRYAVSYRDLEEIPADDLQDQELASL